LAAGEYQRLIIIPDGELTAVPFSALRIGADRKSVIEKIEVVQAPSINVWAELSADGRKGHNPEGQALIVASDAGGRLGNEQLDNIQYTLAEANSIKNILGDKAKVLTSPMLSRDSIQRSLSANPSVLHIAAHGVYSSALPAYSGLVLDNSPSSRELWLAPEISRSSYALDLVVLSACESNQGQYIDGEGLMSLGRSFLESGVRQVVGSLWRVEDQSTSELMASFYQALYNKNLTASAALKSAQQSLLESRDKAFKDPYYWAGFTLMGAS